MAVAVGTMVLAVVLSVLIFGLRTWQHGLAQWELDQQLRLGREKVLRGIDGRIGLRQAEEHSVKIYPGDSENVEWVDFEVDMNPTPTPDASSDNHTCRVITNPGLSLSARTVPDSGTPESLLRTSMIPTAIEIEQQRREITYDLTLSLKRGGRTYSRSQSLRSYIIND
mgnify:CR=1 FL=1